ncbi:MAG: carbohydrate ABC transporter permease [Clostridiaceae bacterium]|uniref:Carbohydrate ABC transporter permease n=1 Tax=Clostridium porci TaxID=2605778 RepID=A0A7X2TBY2_9CLOT|nr:MULTISPECIES: carbohydrate ABC transporter permease [Clostridium]MCI6139306.1 carbohydrate ABC transporter permease [Clostridium sp.]MDY3232084.1 carbohydrate ABC transporter permease [Clostridiaceae bacterium]MSS35935.1 carbohydrate ABC transporter permease [Clostridium porci]
MTLKHRQGKNVKTMPKGTRIFTYICLIWALFVSLFPLVWLVISSLKKDPLARPGFQLPDSIYLEGYLSTFRDLHVLRYFGNSLLIAGLSVAISVVMISMSAYVVGRMEFKGKGLVSGLLYSTMFIPATALTYPVYNLINTMKLYDTRAALILIYSCSGIAVSFFLIKNYYDNIPRELEEAARIDGCGYVQTWARVIFPIARPGIMIAAVLAFLNNWNEYYWASLVLIDRNKLTVPGLLSTFTSSFRTNYNGLFSAMVVIILPPIILYCIFSRFFIEALSGGAVKG